MLLLTCTPFRYVAGIVLTVILVQVDTEDGSRLARRTRSGARGAPSAPKAKKARVQ